MSEHTPGPWRANVFHDGRGGVWQASSSAAVFVANWIDPADARLIAAAPLMADFVYAHAARGDKEALAILETAGVSPPPPSGTLTRDEGQPRPGEPDGSRSAL